VFPEGLPVDNLPVQKYEGTIRSASTYIPDGWRAGIAAAIPLNQYGSPGVAGFLLTGSNGFFRIPL